MDHGLDAVFAHLDTPSLLRAGRVCRRWGERERRPETWRGRAAAVPWARDTGVRDAWLRSLRARGRWRRGHFSATVLGPGLQFECADGDWLLHRRDADRDSVCIYDAAAARALAMPPVKLHVAALSHARRCLATLRYEHGQGDPGTNGRWTCRLRRQTAASGSDCGERWQAVDALARLPCTEYRGPGPDWDARLFWLGDAAGNDSRSGGGHDGTLLFASADCTHHDRWSFCADWIDAATGAVHTAHREHREAGINHAEAVPADGTARCAWMVNGRALYVLDPRAPPDDVAARPLMTLRSAVGAHPLWYAAPLRDGRSVALCYCDRPWRRLPAAAELWDVRAARADAPPVAKLRDSRVLRLLCATARGTVLLSACSPCAAHGGDGGTAIAGCPRCRVTLEEWDPSGGGGVAPETLAEAPRRCYMPIEWCDERRAVMCTLDGELLLCDADAPGDDHDRDSGGTVVAGW